jgi:hypothetical protein
MSGTTVPAIELTQITDSLSLVKSPEASRKMKRRMFDKMTRSLQGNPRLREVFSPSVAVTYSKRSPIFQKETNPKKLDL